MNSATTSGLAETAAPLDMLLVDAALGPCKRFLPDLSTAKWAVALARRPRTTAGRLAKLGGEAGRILAGTSTVAPRARGPAVHRCRLDRQPAAEAAGPALPGGRTRPPRSWWIDAGLEPRDRKRVQFLVENLIEATAPSNVPLVNPASAKAAIDTAGLSLVRGGKQL